MDITLVNRLAMLGVALIGIGNTLYDPKQNPYEVQHQVAMDMNDIMELAQKIEEHKRRNELELYYKGYKIVIKR